jgi:Zn-dependent protease with chaperone function
MRFLSLIGLAAAFTPYQSDLVLAALAKFKPPEFTTVIDSPLRNQIAFTNGQRDTVVINGRRLECCSRTMANVLNHELAHVNGRSHNLFPVPGDIMSYAVTLDQASQVVDDPIIW